MNKPITTKEMKDWVGKTWDRCQKQAWSEAMNRDDIIRMARDQGLPETETEGVFRVNTDDLGRFAALVAAAEREACAKVAEKMLRFYTQAATGVPEAIRARGEK